MIYNTIPELTEQEMTRLKRDITRDALTGCHLWTGAKSTSGYGQAHVSGVATTVHRISWTQTNGPIPAGLQLDHLCRTRNCVNPEHLELVTNRTNALRGTGITAVNAHKTDCKRGHSLTGANLVTRDNTRRCASCRKAYDMSRFALPKGYTMADREPYIQVTADALYGLRKAV